MPDMHQGMGASGQPAAALTQVPPYIPPTVEDLARLQKGGGGETIEKKYFERRENTSAGRPLITLA